MKKAVIMAAITLALALTTIPTSAFGYHGEEGKRAVTTGSVTLTGTWLNESAVTGAGFIFEDAKVVGEGMGNINLGGLGDRIYTPFGGGIRDMGAIGLENISMAPTSGYAEEINLTSGTWVGRCFCVYTSNLTYAKFEILEHTYIPSPTYGDVGSLTIRWYYQDDGSRSFIGEAHAETKTATVAISDTVSCTVVTSANVTPSIDPLQTTDLFSAPEGKELMGMGVNASTLLGAVDIQLPESGEYWVHIEFSYADKDVSDMDMGHMAVYYYDDAAREWKRCEKTGVDREKRVVWANVTHTTVFAAIGTALEESKNDGGGGGTQFPLWIMAVIILAVVLIPLVLVYVSLVRSKKGGT